LQLRGGEYRTLQQLQSDVELICANAMTFNHKPSKVYKNAQAMLKACRKHMSMEKGKMLEALAALHPGGPEAAQKDELEEEMAIRAALPPKKPAAKPSKPPRKSVAPSLAGTSLLPVVLSRQFLPF
jgi:hypothetical protein